MSEVPRRTNQASQLIQEAVAKLILTEVRDPRLPKMLTISYVTVSPNLGHARLYLTALGGDEDANKGAIILNHAAPYLRTKLAKSLKMRTTPQLYFLVDENQSRINHLDDLMRKI